MTPSCPCHDSAEEHAAFIESFKQREPMYQLADLEYTESIRNGSRYAMLPEYDPNDDFDDADGCICGDPRCEE